MRASLSHLYSGVQLSDKAAPSTEKAVLIRRHSAQHLPFLEVSNAIFARKRLDTHSM